MKYLKCLVLPVGLMVAGTAAMATVNNIIPTDPKAPIVISKPGRVVSFRLQANPTTGYSWFLSSYNHDLLTPTSAIYLPPKKGMTGAPGYMLWTFKVNPHKAFTVPQATNIVLSYRRPWEADKAVEKQVTVIFQRMVQMQKR